MANWANTQRFQAYLNTKWGLEQAQLLTGLNNEMIEAFVGRYSRGKRKGQLRGAIEWTKVVRGGWSVSGGFGHVKLPGRISDVHLIDPWKGTILY